MRLKSRLRRDFRGTFKTVSDIEHVKIVDAYLEGKSMQKLGKELDRSSATLHAQITAHDEAIDRSASVQDAEGSKDNTKPRK